VTKGSLDSQTLLQQPRQAPPVGRALRILLGLVLMVYVAPVYFRVPVRVAAGSLLLMLGLIGVYSLIHIVVSRRINAFGPCLGAAVAAGLLVTLYVAGSHVPRHFIGGGWPARRSRLRSDGDSRSPVWKAHRAGVSYLFSPRQA